MGSVIAISAVTIPVIVGMIVLLHVVSALKDSDTVRRMILAIQPVIGIMMAVMAYEFVVKGWQGQQKKSGFIAVTVLSVVAILFATWQTRKLDKEAKKVLDEGA